MLEKRHSRKENRAGFTLVEIIVASILLAIISAGIFSITLSSRKIIRSAHKRQLATLVAQTALEKLRAYLGMDQWNNTASPIYPTANRICYFLNDSANFLNMTAIFGATELATRCGGIWCYTVDNGTGGFEYRKAQVNVTWTESGPEP